MILTEFTTVKHYSDKKVMLLQKETGELYAEPVDTYPCMYTYEETDIPISEEDEINEEISINVEKSSEDN